MLPINALPHIKEILILDYLKYDHCRGSVRLLHMHFAGYDADKEIRDVAQDVEDTLGTLLEDCMLLVATSALRPQVITFIQERIDVTTHLADCIRVRAEQKWIRQHGV